MKELHHALGELSNTKIGHTLAHHYSKNVSGLQALALRKKILTSAFLYIKKKIGLLSIMYP